MQADMQFRICSPQHPQWFRKGVKRKAQLARAAPQQTKKKNESVYPKFEDDKEDADFLPKRDPGSFPNYHPRTQWQNAKSAFERISEAPMEPFADPDAEKKFDPLRDGPLRYLGYANECGEAFAAWLPFWGVPMSYAIAIGYVLTDTGDKGIKTYKVADQELSATQKMHPDVNIPRLVRLLAFERTLDTVIWQLLASVACPGYTIHTVVAIVQNIIRPLQETSQVQGAAASVAASLHIETAEVLNLVDKSFPTLVGLAAIPFIVHPIDNGIHALLNLTLRPQMRKMICVAGQGRLAELQLCTDEECIPNDERATQSPSSSNGSGK